MARTAKVKEEEAQTEEVKANIPNTEELLKEYRTNKMPERKGIALKQKLVSLFNEGKITQDEQDLMEFIFRHERRKGIIQLADLYMLNKIENERIENVCYVKTDDAPAVHHLKKNLKCRYKFDAEYDDGKMKADSVGRYHVYVPRVVPGEHQISYKTALKESKGHPVDPSEIPEDKTLYHRLSLKLKEFEGWFEVEDDTILSTQSKKEEVQYTF